MAVAALPKKESALITASYGLNVAESRLVLLTITIAKEYLHKTVRTISAFTFNTELKKDASQV